MRTHHLKTDVIIMGGGLGGLSTALAACEHGVKVAILDEGKIERSGNSASAADPFMAYLETGEAWDTREAYLEFVQKQGHGIVNIEIHNQLFCKELENRHPKLH